MDYPVFTVIIGFALLAFIAFVVAFIVYVVYKKIKHSTFDGIFTADPKFWYFYKILLFGTLLIGYLSGIVDGIKMMFS